MATRYIRRIKTGDYEIEVRLYGPMAEGQDRDDVPALELLFVETRIDEVEDGGLPVSKLRSLAQCDLVAGKRYMLGWTMWGPEGAKLELALDKPSARPAAAFKKIVEDELPAAGTDIAHSRSTPSGLLWINAKYIQG